ncbi:hypothetical protein M8Z33_27085 [Streptomyces sp. ZAF1911]|uniref:hypothetical protein n=1 Tax=Streptomyces sp. ZAF1911 TaxID=2944129 RepID=UPI00237A7F34|nr:hypothetical protein [Streptomyces sp. ZAF1911]MDD9380252.1 hypothetical protein [Streptomyces sp. ZAF1911]
MERTEELAALRAALEAGPPVHLGGVLGSGKSRLARQLPVADAVDLAGLRAGEAGSRVRAALAAGSGGGLLLVDSVDAPEQAEAVAAALEDLRAGTGGGPCRSVLLVGRLPLRAVGVAVDGWLERSLTSMTLGPVGARAVEAQVRASGVEDPEAVALAVRLAGGNPLLAQLAARTLLAGTPADAPGAVADAMTEEVLLRLDRERPAAGSGGGNGSGGGRRRHALRLLATVRAGDERLLSGGPDLFSALAGLSLVRRERLGLAVREPFRTLFELAYQWRRPQHHEGLRARAADYRRALLTERRDPQERARLVEQGLFLSGDPTLRGSLFPPAEESAAIGPASIGPARAGETEDIGRLMRGWAVRGGFDVRRCERITGQWLDAAGPAAFRLARDRDGRPVGLAALLPVAQGTQAGIEPLLQQHATGLLDGARDRSGGLFLGAAYAADPVAHAQILRDILGQAVLAGHLVVSTASPDYQTLLRALSFRPHGGIRDDVYRCGRRPEVYSHDFNPDGLPAWMRTLGPGGGPAGRVGAEAPGAVGVLGVVDAPGAVAWALARIRDPRALTRSPLLARPGLGTAQALRDWLDNAVLELALADAPADAEAGAILRAYYLSGRPRTHHQAAREVHVSRATYFRRLRRGLGLLGERLPGDV